MTEKFDYQLPNTFYHDGMWSVNPAFPLRLMEESKTFPFTEGDVVLATFRKAGTTWTSRILDLVYNNGDPELAKGDQTQRIRLLELFNFVHKKSEIDLLKEEPSPRVMATHLPARYFLDALEKKKIKVIVVMRNPKDNYVSYFHHYKINRGCGYFPHSWNDYFELIKSNKLIGGDWLDFNLSWWAERHRDNVHVTTYEDMKHDPATQIGEMAKFCGKNLTAEAIKTVAAESEFKKMQSNPDVNFSVAKSFDQSETKFIRKGEVGDWKNYWTPEQDEWLQKNYQPKIEAAGIKLKYEL